MRCFLFYIDDWLSSKHVLRMDAHEERGYLRLLLEAATTEDCGVPDDDSELAVISLLGKQWGLPTKEREKRLNGKTSGQKIRECFRFRPSWAQSGRLYNERLCREWLHQKEVSAARAAAGAKGGRPKKQLVSGEGGEQKPIALKTGGFQKANEKQTESKQKQTTFIVSCLSSGNGSSSLSETENGEMWRWDVDDTYAPFVELYRASGKSVIDDDFAGAWWAWKILDFDQKTLRINRLRWNLENQVYSDPKYIPAPRKFIEQDWKRELRPGSPSKADARNTLMRQRILEDLNEAS